jgi:iron complex outermembrane recepter protein
LVASTVASDLVFGPEKVNGFEVGYKAELFARTLRLDLTAYRYNYNGLQVTALGPAPLFAPSIRNAAKARTTGVEGSFEWLAMEHISFDGNVGYNHARYLSFPNAQCWSGQSPADGCIGGAQDLSGQPLNRAPNVTFKLGGDYKTKLIGGWMADLSLSGAYTSSYLTAADYNPGGPQPAYWLLNAALHISSENDRYRFSIVGRDLTDSFYKIDTHTKGLGSPYQFVSFFNRPREVVAQFEYNF